PTEATGGKDSSVISSRCGVRWVALPIGRQRQVDSAALGTTPVYRLGELHVAHPVRECGQADRLLTTNRANKLLLDSPRTLLLRRNIDRPEPRVAFARAAEAFAILLEAERSLAAEQPHLR